MDPKGIRYKADAVKPQIPKPRPSYQFQGQVATANYILPGFCCQDQGNVS